MTVYLTKLKTAISGSPDGVYLSSWKASDSAVNQSEMLRLHSDTAFRFGRRNASIVRYILARIGQMHCDGLS